MITERLFRFDLDSKLDMNDRRTALRKMWVGQTGTTSWSFSKKVETCQVFTLIGSTGS
jgi:hypothetical protein